MERFTEERVRARVENLDARVAELELDARNRPPPYPGIFVRISAFDQAGNPYGRSSLFKVDEDDLHQLIDHAREIERVP